MAELVGGAILNAFINVLFERIATPEFKDLLVTQKMDMKLLHKLETYLTTINAVLYDAEYRQIALKDVSVKPFLDNIRGTAYEADDLCDLIAYEVTAAEIKADQHATASNLPCNLSSLCNLLNKKSSVQVSIPRNVTKKIEEIVEELEILVKQIDPLGLKKNNKTDGLPQREPTSPVVEESEIIGRNSEVDAIFNLLQAADDVGIGVIPIFGMGGIGKTTLARLVYNDSKATELFATRAWVCVSDNYDALRIKKELLQQVGNSEECDKLSPQKIDEKLKKSLEDKKYLIVLDDVWDISYDNWNKLQVTLKSGAQGSKIIVTTRIKDIASMVGTIEGFHLDQLNDDSCWQIFVKHAFNNVKDCEQNAQSLREKIVSKCAGLPLAAKMLGGVMRGKQVAQWDAILNSEMWEIDSGVLPALMLSYQLLPSQLKQCFAYCAIFPEDYKIRKEELIQLWMAEGFLVKPRGGGQGGGEQEEGDNKEELGEKYFQVLVSRSFLQEHNNKYDGSYFLMHDLISDLAQHISGEFSVRMDEDRSCKFTTRNRYFSFKITKENSCNMLGGIHKPQFLRTFWSFGLEHVGFKEAKKIVDGVVNDLLCLRVLSLRNFDVVELPKSIKHLKHLRYLNLASTHVKRMPKTVCSLFNLQTLILYECVQLVELPKNFGNLINLHYIDIRGTTSLEKMPTGMGNLNKIVSLELDRCKDCTFLLAFELPSLERLSISNCDAVGKVSMSKPLRSLKTLLIENMGQWEEWFFCEENDPRKCGLLPKLEKLTIKNCPKMNIISPDGPTCMSFYSLNSLLVEGCGKLKISNLVAISNFSQLPKRTKPPNPSLISEFKSHHGTANPKIVLEQLPSAMYGLYVKGLTTERIEEIGVALNALEDVTIVDCDLCECIPLEVFPVLKTLYVLRCDKLKFLSAGGEPLPQSLTSLASLEIVGCDNLICFPRGGLPAPNMTNLRLSSLRNLKSLPEGMHVHLFALKHLFIGWCWKIESFPEGGLPANLQSLKIMYCKDEVMDVCWQPGLQTLHSLSTLELSYYDGDNMNCFPFPPGLTSLEIGSFGKLKFMNCKDLQHLTHLTITLCSNLESFLQEESPSSPSEPFQQGGLLPNLQSLHIENCDKLIAGRLQWGLQRFKALSHFSLRYYEGDDLDSFPEESLLPSTLTSLYISDFKSLREINCKGLQHLTSLSKLEIYGCYYVRLSKEELPSSLSVVRRWEGNAIVITSAADTQ